MFKKLIYILKVNWIAKILFLLTVYLLSVLVSYFYGWDLAVAFAKLAELGLWIIAAIFILAGFYYGIKDLIKKKK